MGGQAEGQAEETGRLGDPARLRALAATGLSDTTVSPALDRLTALASQLLGTPVALVSLVALEHQFFASACGLSGAAAAERRTPLSHSFCRHVVAADTPMLVPDARHDARVSTNPAVSEDGILAYAGIPLHSADGHVLGSFCVADLQPRRWSLRDVDLLHSLAAAAESEIALRQANAELLLSATRMQEVLNTALDAFISINETGRIRAWNSAAERMFGWLAAEAIGADLTTLIIPERWRAAHDRAFTRVRVTGESQLGDHRLELSAVDRRGREIPVELALQIGVDSGGRRFHAFIRDIGDRKAADEVLSGNGGSWPRSAAFCKRCSTASTPASWPAIGPGGWRCSTRPCCACSAVVSSRWMPRRGCRPMTCSDRTGVPPCSPGTRRWPGRSPGKSSKGRRW